MSSENTAPAQIVIGTAGHVDHGKSTLVQALTGTDPDRLPQEKKRGLTIELGFAFLPGASFQQDCDIAFIDCPGHQKFIRHAISGMAAMDGCLLLVAADEGVCAQTREHLSLLRLLHVKWGRIVISKASLVSQERLQALSDQVLDLCSGTVFAQETPLITDAHDGLGLDALRTYVFQQAAQRMQNEHQDALEQRFRLGIDRVFSVKGHGTVVTGSILTGSVSVGDTVQCFPGPTARVRALQVRSLEVERAFAGQRCAVNVAGVEKSEIERGAWLAAEQSMQATTRVDILAQCIEPGLKHGEAIRVYHGAGSQSARCILLEEQSIVQGQARAQLRLDQALFLSRNDQIILRRPSPSATIAAATVLHIDAPKHKRFHAQTRKWFDDAQGDEATRLASWLEMRDEHAATHEEVLQFCGGAAAFNRATASSGVGIIKRTLAHNMYYWGTQAWQRCLQRAQDSLRAHAQVHAENPWYSLDSLRKSCAASCPADAWEDRLADWQLHGSLLRYQRSVCDPSLLPEISAPVFKEIQVLLDIYQQAGIQAAYNNPICEARPDPVLAQQALDIASSRGWLIRLSDRQHMHRSTVEHAVQQMAAAFQSQQSVDFQWAKKTFNCSRRFALPLLEWCDLHDLSKRQGNERFAGSQLTDGQLPQPMLSPLP